MSVTSEGAAPAGMPRTLPSLADVVLGWYGEAARDLPWRRPGMSAWAVLVSEVMLQQTPVARVVPAYEQWLARWPAPADLAAERAGAAIRQWGRLGYPRRALRLHAAATEIVDRHGGQVPADLDALLALPGVGAYTARAVASFAFGQRHAVVDTNVRRVLARVVRGAPGAADAGYAEDLRLTERLLPTPPGEAARFGVAFMEFGALVCTARAPRCDRCPVAQRCAWRQTMAAARAGQALAGATAAQAQRSESAATPRAVRRQPYAGTDRQARGVLLGALRATSALSPAALLGYWPDRVQAQRALAGLLADGLAVQAADGTLSLP